MQPPPPPPLAKPAKPHAPHVRGGPPPPPPSAKKFVLHSSDPEGTAWKFEPSSAKPIDVLKFDRHFADALGFSCSEPGADGVMFVGWSDGGTVVLKANGTIMADAFAYELGLLCKMPFPSMQLCRYSIEPRWEEIYHNVGRLNELRKERERLGPAKFLERVIYMLMEFVPGRDLYHSDPKQLFGDGAVSPAGAELLFQIGRIVAFDVFVNNWDRFPLKGVWTHEGNFNNFLFVAGGVVAIDQSVQCVNPAAHPAAFDKYHASVERFLEEAAGRVPAGPMLRSVRDAFVGTCGYDIGTEGVGHFQRGLMQGVADISANVSVAQVEALYERLNTYATTLIDRMVFAADKQFRYGMTNCNVEFFRRMLALFGRYAHAP